MRRWLFGSLALTGRKLAILAALAGVAIFLTAEDCNVDFNDPNVTLPADFRVDLSDPQTKGQVTQWLSIASVDEPDVEARVGTPELQRAVTAGIVSAFDYAKGHPNPAGQPLTATQQQVLSVLADAYILQEVKNNDGSAAYDGAAGALLSVQSLASEAFSAPSLADADLAKMQSALKAIGPSSGSASPPAGQEVPPLATEPLVPLNPPSTTSVGTDCAIDDVTCIQAQTADLRKKLSDRLATIGGATTALALYYPNGTLPSGLDANTLQAANVLLDNDPANLQAVHDLFADRADHNQVLHDYLRSWSDPTNFDTLRTVAIAGDYRDATAKAALDDAEGLIAQDPAEARLRMTTYLLAHQNEWTANRIVDSLIDVPSIKPVGSPGDVLAAGKSAYSYSRAVVSQLDSLGVNGASQALQDLALMDSVASYSATVEHAVSTLAGPDQPDPAKALELLKQGFDEAAKAGVDGAAVAASRMSLLISGYQAAQAITREIGEQQMNGRYQAVYDAVVSSRGMPADQIVALRDKAKADADQMTQDQADLRQQIADEQATFRTTYGDPDSLDPLQCGLDCQQHRSALENTVNSLQKQIMDKALQRRPLLLTVQILNNRLT